MWHYAQLKFREHQHEPEPSRVRLLIEEAREHVQSLREYQRAGARTALNSQQTEGTLSVYCLGCGALFGQDADRFCSKCGEQRAGIG